MTKKKSPKGGGKNATISPSRLPTAGAPEPPTADQEVERTFAALQAIEQGQFQSIGDEVLPWSLPVLSGLHPFGLNAEGKTVKGVPDSFVGATPATCSAAVEYTTQKTQQDTKLEHDFDEVRKQCPNATTIVICTNRSLHGVDLSAVTKKATAAKVDVEIVDGRRLARFVNTRHDLRYEHLRIPIGAHTIPSLVSRGSKVVHVPIEVALGRGALDRVVPRVRASHVLSERFGKPASMTLVVAPAGMGKSTWSAAEATRYSTGRFVVWTTAKKLPLADADPIGIHVVQTAYGSADPARLHELADLIQRSKGQACIFIDGIDESHDFSALERAIHVFRTSVLGSLVHLVLLCRQEGVADVQNAFTSLFSEVSRDRDGIITIDELSDNDAELLLTKYGASRREIRELVGWLPPAFRGVPLFLVSALRAHRSGQLPLGPDPDVIAVFAQQCVREIADRMRREGVGPSMGAVEAFLKRVAAIAFERPQHNVPLEDMASVPGGQESGENSLTSRAVQSGLLLASDEDVSFAHPLYLEYFAARALESTSTAWADRNPSLQTAAGRRVVSRLAGRLADPDAFVRALLSIDGVAACEAAIKAKTTLSPDLINELIKTPARLLESRFPSDRRRAIRLLSRLPSKKAAAHLVTWWNNAVQSSQVHSLGAVADAFLTLQLPGAAIVVLNHHQLRHPSDMPWYEPSFVRRCENLSPAFSEALKTVAFARRKQNEMPPEALMLLAILRDERLTSWLADQVQTRALTVSEHRALIHLNTEQSIAVFVESVDRHLAARRALTDGEARAEREDATVSIASDIAMFPHDQLTPVIEAALESPCIDHVWFGMRWADTLPDPGLVAGYAAARIRYSNYTMSLSAHLIERLLKQLPFAQVVTLFRSLKLEAQKQMVHLMYQVSDPSAEAFLVGLLENEDFRFDAIQSLGMIRAFGAAPSVARFLNDPKEHVRSMCLTTLGRLRYTPALPHLVAQLEVVTRTAGSPSRSVNDSNLEYGLVGAIGKLGGNDAVAALVASIPKLEDPKQAVLGLLYLEAIPELRQLMIDGDVSPESFVSGLASKRLRDRMRRVGSWIEDDVLLDAALQVARDHFTEARPHTTSSPYFAIAEFHMTAATEFLIEVAKSDNDAETKTRDTPAGASAAEEARMLLAQNGIEPYTSRALEAELDRIARKGYFWDYEIRHLVAWPRAVVRTALLSRLDGHDVSSALLSAFEWFALPSDRTIFERLEQSTRIDIADVAHQYLAGA